jgi:hypothetical protein
MLKELLDVVSVGLVVTTQGLNTVSTGVTAVDNLVNAAEKSTRMIDIEAANLLKMQTERLSANVKTAGLLDSL